MKMYNANPLKRYIDEKKQKKTKNEQVAEIVWTISQLSKSIDQHPRMF